MARGNVWFDYLVDNPESTTAVLINRLSEIQTGLLGEEVDYLSQIDKYNARPPTGGAVERDRLEFYLSRAAKFKKGESEFRFELIKKGDNEDIFLESEGALKFPYQQDTLTLMRCMLQQQDVERELRFTEEAFEMFQGKIQLKRELFERAIRRLPRESSPGYPFVANDFSKNEELTLDLNDPDEVTLLYGVVNDYFLMLADDSFEAMLGSLEGLTIREATIELFLSGYVMPTMAFVKGEPTKKEKIARLIQGTNIVINTVSRILLGDYLDMVPENWRESIPKIGMDFNTEEGKRALMIHYQKLHDAQEWLKRTYPGMKHARIGAMTSDVQGWEWIVRFETAVAYWVALCENFHGLHFKLLWRFARLDLLSLISIDTDGYVHAMPWFIIMSGKLVTHHQNSVTRAAEAILKANYPEDVWDEFYALSGNSKPHYDEGGKWYYCDMDYDEFNTLAFTNGDDCINNQVILEDSYGRDITLKQYEDMCVLTDVYYLNRRTLRFSSQVFSISEAASEACFYGDPAEFLVEGGFDVRRIPDNFMKTILQIPEKFDDLEATAGVLSHYKEHPGKDILAELMKAYGNWLVNSLVTLEEEDYFAV